MKEEQIDYEVIKPDQSEIAIKRSHGMNIGKFIFSNKDHKYEFLGETPMNHDELIEVTKSMQKLNKKSILPRWLKWGSTG